MGRINQAHPILLFISLRFSNFSNTLGDALRVHMRMAEPAFGIIAGYLIHAWYPGENSGAGTSPHRIRFLVSHQNVHRSSDTKWNSRFLRLKNEQSSWFQTLLWTLAAENLSENAQASLRTIRWIMAILIQASLVRGLIS